MNFLSKLAKGDDSSKPTNSDNINPDHEKSSDLFSSARVVAEAAQSQFGGGGATYDKPKAASAAADLLDAAQEYGKFSADTGVGKYTEQAEGYLRKYGSSDSTAAAELTEKEVPAAAAAEYTEKEVPAAADDEIKKPAAAELADEEIISSTDDEIKKPVAAELADEEISYEKKPAAAELADEDIISSTDDEIKKPAAVAADEEISYEKKPAADEDIISSTDDEIKKPVAATELGERGAGDYLKTAEGLLNKPSGGTAEGTTATGAGDFMKKAAGGFFK